MQKQHKEECAWVEGLNQGEREALSGREGARRGKEGQRERATQRRERENENEKERKRRPGGG